VLNGLTQILTLIGTLPKVEFKTIHTSVNAVSAKEEEAFVENLFK